MNLFRKPDEQSQTCLSFAMARKSCMLMNLFRKPDEQSQTCLNYAMARKSCMLMNKSYLRNVGNIRRNRQ